MKRQSYYNQFTKDDVNLLLKDKKIQIIGDYVNSKTPTLFRCNICDNEFIGKYENVKSWVKSGCKKCNHRVADTEDERYQNKLKQINNKKSSNIEILELNKNDVSCKCLICGDEFSMAYSSIMRGSFHRPCAMKETSKKRISTVSQITQKMRRLGKNITVDFKDYVDAKSIVHCSCNECGHKWNTQARNLTRKRGCPNCARIKQNNAKKLSIDRYQHLLDKHNLELIEDFDCGSAKVLVRCIVCNHVFKTSMTYLDNFGVGCTNCNKISRGKIAYHLFKQKLKDLNSHIELQSDFTFMSEKCEFYCVDCHQNFIKTPHDFNKSPFCPICNINSNLEVAVKHYLIDNSISFELHKSFCNLTGIKGGLLSYDFYLLKYNLLIECQGEQHEKPIEYFGGEEQFKVQQEHDIRKYEYAKNNNINLVNIWYYDLKNIEKILSNILN